MSLEIYTWYEGMEETADFKFQKLHFKILLFIRMNKSINDIETLFYNSEYWKAFCIYKSR